MKISEGGSNVYGEVIPLQAVLLSCTHEEAALTLLLLQFDVKQKNVFVTRTKAGQNMIFCGSVKI